MKKLILTLSLLAAFSATELLAQAPAPTTPPAEPAAPAAPPAKDPSLEQRVLDLEAYLNNVGRQADTATNNVKSNVGGAGAGHNAWMMTSTALVLFMTLPGLALFYGGLVRKKNVLSVLAQCFGIAGLVTILWWACGYSFVFADGAGAYWGDFSKFAFLKGVDGNPNTNYAYWVSHNVFAMFQMMFAIITPALIIGAIAERMKFSAVLAFVALWMFAVYFPLAHMVWGINGAFNGVWNADAVIPAIDFAGGTVVHMSSGWSALVLCLVLGKRLGFRKQSMAPHSMTLCMVGTGMLWVGWYGFNAGSAVAADGIAANAFATTTIAAAVGSFAWALTEWIFKGKPSILGFCSGAVAGLVVVTPACGFVTVGSAVWIGILAGVIPFLACTKIKSMFGYDDALDTFGVHAVGGTLGAFLTGIFATDAANGNLVVEGVAGKNGLAKLVKEGGLWTAQCKVILFTIVLSVVATYIIAKIIDLTIGLRASEETETVGLDLSEHGEEGYHG
ncbi:MAG: ammonium transporter [Pedosphaera sp.]|nr:ammonium transporter [Pedosphaera sp.]